MGDIWHVYIPGWPSWIVKNLILYFNKEKKFDRKFLKLNYMDIWWIYGRHFEIGKNQFSKSCFISGVTKNNFVRKKIFVRGIKFKNIFL